MWTIYLSHHVWQVNLNSLCWSDLTSVHFFFPKTTFQCLCIVFGLQYGKYMVNKGNMVFQSLTWKQDIIKEDQHKFPKMWTKNVVHIGLKSRMCINQPKRHNPQLVVTSMVWKCSLWNVLQSDTNLVLEWSSYFLECFMLCCYTLQPTCHQKMVSEFCF